MKKWNIVLGLSVKSIPDKIKQARFIVGSMERNKEIFPSPVPALADVVKAANELEEAYFNTKDGGKEQTAIMYNKAFYLELELTDLSHYVWSIANRKNRIGGAIIYAAGMDIKKQHNGSSRTFTVVNTTTEGSVKLQTKGEGRAGYVWEYSLDEENWTVGVVTVKASAIINGLTPGKRYYFRVAVVKAKQDPWIGPINIIVT